MTKKILLIVPLLLISIYGCSSDPISPERQANIFDPEVFTFQLAASLADPTIPSSYLVPTDVPINQIVKQKCLPLFACYALAAFDIYYEPSDWDDYLEFAKPNRRCNDYEPSDWDDYLAGISRRIDPLNNYEPSDWDDWLCDGNYEPSDWDDYLYTRTIGELADLN